MNLQSSRSLCQTEKPSPLDAEELSTGLPLKDQCKIPLGTRIPHSFSKTMVANQSLGAGPGDRTFIQKNGKISQYRGLTIQFMYTNVLKKFADKGDKSEVW